MNFYIDFEATQPQCEIIAIGAVAENGKSFYSLVKPQLSSLNAYVSKLTHITSEDLENAKSIDEVLVAFDIWMMEQEPDFMKCNFISYGDDKQFIKATLPAIKNCHSFVVAACLLARIEDKAKEIYKFFRGSISLIKAFNYIESLENKQNHNPLEDALMLQKVYNYTQNNEPLTCHPSCKNNEEQKEIKMPSGTFWCKTSAKKKAKCYNFASCDDAIDWLIEEVIRPQNPDEIHRDRVMSRIMISIRKKTKYCNFLWGRVKEENNDE